MTLFTRAVAQRVRLLFARCVAGRPRGPAPPVVIRIRDGTRTLAASTSEGVILTHTAPASEEPDDLLVLPATVLAEVEGGTDEAVTLEREAGLRSTVQWHAGKPRTLPIELILPGRQHELPVPPALVPVPARLLAALHECGRTAAKESGRFALSKVQIQGKAGRVVGTDGKVAILWRGFDFQFPDDVLVPALPVFGARPLARVTEVEIGRSATHLVVGAGPWSVATPTDARGKYPDVAGVVPRAAPTTVVIDESDAAALLPVLPGLPGGGHELRPVTIDAGNGVHVRGQTQGGEKSGETRDVSLAHSTASGPAAHAVLDRRVLARALGLGCRTLRLAPDKPVAFEGGDVVLVAAPLDPALRAPPPADAAHTPPTNPEWRPTMKPETNGHTPPRGDPGALGDPLELAEELRAALADAATKAARLVAALRQGKKEKKVLSALMDNLKQLNLGGTP